MLSNIKEGNSDIIQAGNVRLLLNLDNLAITVPSKGLEKETDVKQWLWKHHQDAILQALSVRVMTSSSTLSLEEEEENEEEEETTATTATTTTVSNHCVDMSSDSTDQQEPSLPPQQSSSSLTHQTTANQNDAQRTLDAITNVQQRLLDNERPRLVYGYLLEALLKFTNSAFGFIAEVKINAANQQQFVNCRACTNISWSDKVSRAYERAIETGIQVHNLSSLFGTSLTTGQAVISNDPANDPRSGGVPVGHIPLKAYLGIPLFKNKKIVGLLSLANKPGGYSQADIDMLQPFTVTIGLLLQVYLHIEDNECLINNLEERVRERTHKLTLANANLEQANRRVVAASEAQLQHFACMSHEIRTPLNCIVGLSSLLQETATNPAQEESLRMIQSSGDLLLTVVNDVLDYSKLVTSELRLDVQRTSLQDTLNTVVHLIGLKAKPKQVQVRTQYLDPRVPEFIQTDGYRLQQVLYNLLGNAIRFSNPNGVVELSVSVEAFSPPNDGGGGGGRGTIATEELSSFLEGSVENEELSDSSVDEAGKGAAGHVVATQDALCLTVKDFGKGICKQDFDRIFQPFRQANSEEKNISGGTGLGLAVVSRIVRAMGGRVSVDSQEGKWTKFTVEIPLVEVPSLPLAHVEAPDLKNVESLEHTLVAFVGQNQNNRMDLPSYSLLTDLGVECVHCKTLPELEQVISQRTNQSHQDSTCIVLVSEQAYQSKSYHSIGDRIPSGLVTIGPNFLVPEAAGHISSLESTLPSVLLRTIRNTVSGIRAGAKPDSGAKTPEPCPKSIVPYKEWGILIAEDNKVNQKVLQRLLKKLGIEKVDIASNGRIAVEMEKKTTYDLVLMDMQMPEMDGLEACRAILNNEETGVGSRQVPMIVFVTAHVSSDYEAACRAAGGIDFLAKPVNFQALESLFQSLSARQNDNNPATLCRTAAHQAAVATAV